MVGWKKNIEMKDEDNKMSMFGVMVLTFIWTFMSEKSFITEVLYVL